MKTLVLSFFKFLVHSQYSSEKGKLVLNSRLKQL